MQCIRTQILMRDHHLCQPCRRQGQICAAKAVDYIKAKAFGKMDKERDLEEICDECHKKYRA
ncbi:HNH endonuclease [Candidatus Williamhamiltonella defendens]|uniref:HNH endonuclease n=1 Tax=Candidatus Williamhamiltonella defendens TaxID=138072 RepID=UPI001F47DB34|nr:HNH endonuclease [Candidatus Hamiltonella defensa]